MSSNDVVVALRALGQVAFKNAMNASAESVERIGASAERSSKQVKASGDDAQKSSKGWKASARSVAGWAISAGAIAGAASYVKTATGAATDLNEEINKASVVFRGAEKPLIDWSNTTASSLGIARQEALAAAGTFGNMLVPMGFARKDAANMSQRMVGLAADMASFNNADPSETLDALRAGLAGESEPLRKFGVFLNDARLKQEALNMGIYDGKGPLDSATKAQATYALILKDTKDAQGDFKRTSGSLANQQRILKAQWTNLAATIGKAVLPVALKLAQALTFLTKHTEILIPLVILITGLFAAYAVAQTAAAIAALSFNAAFLLIPLAIAAVVAGIIIAYKKVGWFRDAINWLWGAIKTVFNWIKANWKVLLVGLLAGPFGLAVALIAKHWDKVKKGASAVVDWFKGWGSKIVNAIANGIKAAPGVILDAIKSLLPWKVAGKIMDTLGGGGHFAGGVLYGNGLRLVGENGPEIMQLPGGTRVKPLQTSSNALLPSLAGVGGGGSQTTAHFYLDRRLIATAVAEDTADQKARR